MSHVRIADCVNVTDYCTVEASIYGYYPSLAANSAFVAIFSTCLVIQLVQGFVWKTRTYTIAIALGCLGELIGYIGRILLYSNPYDSTGFNMQICCLILSPAFLSAGIYLTLKHIILNAGPEFSRIQAKYYTWIFISCDLVCLIFQGAGGGIAATADDNLSLQSKGNDLAMTGIAGQVASLLIFAITAGDYARRAYAQRLHFNESVVSLLSSFRFRLFVYSVMTAFTAILLRCIYRIAEMAGGWRNPIQQNEAGFIALDGVMCTIATICLTAFHPGYLFPQMRLSHKRFAEEETHTSAYKTEDKAVNKS